MGGESARGAARAAPISGRLAALAGADIFALLHFGDGDLDIFQHELQLLGIELLRALAEPGALVCLQKQLETLDRFLRIPAQNRSQKLAGFLRFGHGQLLRHQSKGFSDRDVNGV
jgi:hypothetical protein